MPSIQLAVGPGGRALLVSREFLGSALARDGPNAILFYQQLHNFLGPGESLAPGIEDSWMQTSRVPVGSGIFFHADTELEEAGFPRYDEPPPPPPPPPPVVGVVPIIPTGPAFGGVDMPWSLLLKVASGLLTSATFLSWMQSVLTKSKVLWDEIPSEVKVLLVAAGVAAGTTLIMDLANNDSSAQGGVVPAGFTPAWKANGIQFYRSASGMLGVLNGKGKWKQWRPKKPIVIFAGGAANIKTLLKADRALDRQAQQLAKVLRRRSPAPARRSSGARLLTEGATLRLTSGK